MFTTIIIFIVILSILVFAHEIGHFWTARKFGVSCPEFGWGFPPRAIGIYRPINKAGADESEAPKKSRKWKVVWGSREVDDADGTVYSINWLPLGGFVKIKGEQGDSKDETDSFGHQKIWKRCIILSAGVTMNIIIAALFISLGYMLGLPQDLDGVSPAAIVRDRNIQIMQVLPDSAAANAGVQFGDVILSINNQQFSNYTQLQAFLADKAGQELDYQLRRGREEFDLAITPKVLGESDEVGIGVAIAETGLVSFPWYRAIWEGIKSTVFLIWFIIAAFYGLFRDIFTGVGVSQSLSGPVGIATITGQMAQLGFVYLLQFTAILSVNLAILNYLPFPALDGGRVLFLIIEKIRGRAVPEKVEAFIHNAGFALLIFLVILVTYRDITKFFS
ncbi:MAG: RIP metalloprotease RseP [bacterium]|nr:RIP metalloprotease RseP [bacterium]